MRRVEAPFTGGRDTALAVLDPAEVAAWDETGIRIGGSALRSRVNG